MKRNYFSHTLLLMVLALSLPFTLHAVEGMSSEEVTVREKHDRVNMELSEKLYECLARNNVHPRDMGDAICLDEKIEIKRSAETFNKFMRDKEAKSSPAERRGGFRKFEEVYSTYTIHSLQELHQQYCITKWGGSDTTECQAIASQIRIKELSAHGK